MQDRTRLALQVLLGCGFAASLAAAAEARHAAAAQTTPTEPAPLCRIAADPEYGFNKERPVQVGGSPMFGAARERRYLDALRGPKGEALRYTRDGSLLGPDGDTMLDAYTVTYDGLEKPLTLFLDWYHFTDLLAPQGLVCGRAFDLHTPPPDPFMAKDQIEALAAEVAAAPGFRAGPVQLGADPGVGLVVDRFRMLSRRSRAPVAPRPAPANTQDEPAGTIVVVYPQTCGSRLVSPSAIVVVDGQGNASEPTSTSADKAAIVRLVPGQQVPDGSMAASFAVDALQARLHVGVSFKDAACVGEFAQRMIPVAYSAAQLVDSPMPARPAADATGVPWVAVQALIDPQGAFQQLRPLGGPPGLVSAAVEAVKTWKALPARANGSPLVTPVVLEVTFQPPLPR